MCFSGGHEGITELSLRYINCRKSHIFYIFIETGGAGRSLNSVNFHPFVINDPTNHGTWLWQPQPLSAASPHLMGRQLTAVHYNEVKAHLHLHTYSPDQHMHRPDDALAHSVTQHMPRGTLFGEDLMREHVLIPHLTARAVTFWCDKILKIHTVSAALWLVAAHSLAFK